MVTRLVLSSGRSFPTNMVLTPPVLTMETQTFNWKELMSISTKPLEADMSQEPSLWISSQVPWTPSVPVLSVNSSVQTILSSDNLVPVTTGPKVTILKVLNSLTPSLMLCVKKPKVAIASKVIKSPTPSVVVPDPAWELS